MKARHAIDQRALHDAHDAYEAECHRNTAAYRREDELRRLRAGAVAPANGLARAFHVSVLASHSSPSANADSPLAAAAALCVPRSEPVTYFHSRTVPALSLKQLGAAMDQATQCGDEALLVALVLMDRYAGSADVKPTLHSMHRLYVTCLHIGMKTHSDHYFTNATFARAAGVSLAELNTCETEVLAGLRWRSLVTSEQAIGFVRGALNKTPPDEGQFASKLVLQSFADYWKVLAATPRCAPHPLSPPARPMFAPTAGVAGMPFAALATASAPVVAAAAPPAARLLEATAKRVPVPATVRAMPSMVVPSHYASACVTRVSAAVVAAEPWAPLPATAKRMGGVALRLPTPPIVTVTPPPSPVAAAMFCDVDGFMNSDPETPPNSPVSPPSLRPSAGNSPMQRPLLHHSGALAAIVPPRGLMHLRVMFRPLPTVAVGGPRHA